jgi:1-acyl-sn-glycerol-3-phosphate acyltransferase
VRGLLRSLRSLLAVLAVGLLFMWGSVVLRLGVVPAAFFRPELRFPLISRYMKWMCRNILRLLQLGGAHVRRSGQVPTGSPVVIVANHQSLLDICQISLLAQPFVPAFVTRTRYGRFVPLVSTSVRMLGSPLIDPQRDPRGALDLIRDTARTLPHGIVIFPEGHRTRDGDLRPFKSAGVQAILEDRPTPVYLIVNEGTWRVRRLADTLFNLPLVDARSEVLGPFEPPADKAEIPAFLQGLRERIAARLTEMRTGGGGLSGEAGGR